MEKSIVLGTAFVACLVCTIASASRRGSLLTCGHFRHNPEGTWTFVGAPRIDINGTKLETGAVFNERIVFGDFSLGALLDQQCISAPPDRPITIPKSVKA